jgi:SAM-dependent methyltransferase
MQTENELKYTSMQKNWYEFNAKHSFCAEGRMFEDHIVGNFENQEKFPYEQWLFKYYQPEKEHICYEYGCGPGRQIRRILPLFSRVDGIDIAKANLDNAKLYLGKNYLGNLKVTNGIEVPLEDKYDFCYSVICLQHIPCYTVRRKILEGMYTSLKEGGCITIQLAFGKSINGTPTFGYKENFYDATSTNGRLDCRVDTVEEVIQDFEDIGFKDVNTELSNTVEDHHPCWIWIYGKK